MDKYDINCPDEMMIMMCLFSQSIISIIFMLPHHFNCNNPDGCVCTCAVKSHIAMYSLHAIKNIYDVMSADANKTSN